MNKSDIFTHLMTWTPFLLDGFGWNILISITAAIMGTVIGGALAWLRFSPSERISRGSLAISSMIFKLPTLALMFYVAILLPNDVSIPGTELTYPFPHWIKAAMALSAAQVGFISQNLSASINFWKKGEVGAALLFIPNWGNNLLITVIASSSASLVGVSELVSRCNKVINASDNTDLMIPIYLYASLIFLCFCYPLMLLMKQLKKVVTNRFAADVPTETDLTLDERLE